MAMVMNSKANDVVEAKSAVLTVSPVEHITLAEARAIADSMAEAAALGHPGFRVRGIDVLERLADADELYLVRTPAGSVVGFGGFRRLQPLPGYDGLTARYICGILIHPRYQQRGIGGDLLGIASHGVSIVVGHTQNPHVLAAFRKRFVTWPNEDCASLNPRFATALRRYLESNGRRAHFDRVSGVVRQLYAKHLYDDAGEPGFHALAGDGDGLLLLGFTSMAAYSKAVDSFGPKG